MNPLVRQRENELARLRCLDPEIRVKAMLSGARVRARQYGIAFEITLQDVLPLPTRCPVLGLELNYGAGRPNDHNRPSLDRFDNAVGYVRGNVAIISKRANWLKNDGSPAELMRVAQYANSRT